MSERPTHAWRQHGSGASPTMIDATDLVLDAFDQEAAALCLTASDDEVLSVIERTVVALNEVDAGHVDGDFATIERDDLCEYIDAAIAAAGVDLDALAERRGAERSDLTDAWREW